MVQLTINRYSSDQNVLSLIIVTTCPDSHLQSQTGAVPRGKNGSSKWNRAGMVWF